jgi:hypothetical protein
MSKHERSYLASPLHVARFQLLKRGLRFPSRVGRLISGNREQLLASTGMMKFGFGILRPLSRGFFYDVSDACSRLGGSIRSRELRLALACDGSWQSHSQSMCLRPEQGGIDGENHQGELGSTTAP